MTGDGPPPAGRATAGPGDVALLALPFVWAGMVLAISFVETPLKFQAPGITLALGLGIGRLVFLALNAVEVVLALALAGLVVRRRAVLSAAVVRLLTAVGATLLVQLLVLRPVLDARTVAVIAGTPPPPAPWHLLYIVLEVGKVALLLALGAITARSMLAAAADSRPPVLRR